MSANVPIKQRFFEHLSGPQDNYLQIVDSMPIETIRTLTGKRRLVETVAGQLEQRSRIKTASARNLQHLLNRIIRKIVSHTVCVWLNLKFNNDPLKLRLLVN